MECLFQVLIRHKTMVVLSDTLMTQRFWAEGIQKFRGTSSLLTIIVEYECFWNKACVKWLIFRVGNQELKVLEVAEGSRERMCCIRDIWPVRCEGDFNVTG